MSPAADWYLNQLATHGIATVLAAQTAALAVVWGSAWAAVDRIQARQLARRGIRQLENFANHPAHRSPRKEKP